MNLKGVRVLLVEDEPDSREVLAFILEYCGAEVATRDRCLSAGFQEYLSKPVAPDVLCNTVSTVARLGA